MLLYCADRGEEGSIGDLPAWYARAPRSSDGPYWLPVAAQDELDGARAVVLGIVRIIS